MQFTTDLQQESECGIHMQSHCKIYIYIPYIYIHSVYLDHYKLFPGIIYILGTNNSSHVRNISSPPVILFITVEC